MTEAEYAKKLEELDRQRNDPDIPMDPARVWALSADLRRDVSGSDLALEGAKPGHPWPGHQSLAHGARPS